MTPSSEFSLAALTGASARRSWRARAGAALCSAAVLFQPMAPLAGELRAFNPRLGDGVFELSADEMDGTCGGTSTYAPVTALPDAFAGIDTDMGSGGTLLSETDINIPLASQTALLVARTQTSSQVNAVNDAGESLFGVGWWSNLDTYLDTSGGDLIWHAPNGAQYTFEYYTNTPYYTCKPVVDDGLAAKLEVIPTIHGYTTYRLTVQNNSRYHFQSDRGPHGNGLIRYEDSFGESVELTWGELVKGGWANTDKLRTMSDNGGSRYLAFTYKTATDQIEEIRLKSTYDAGLNKLLVTYNYGNATGPYVPDLNLRSVEFPNGLEKRYAYGSYELSGSWTHVTDADDNTEPSRTLCEKAMYFHDGTTWVEKPYYRADWHEFTEGYTDATGSYTSDSWVEKQYLYDFEADDWALAYDYDWTILTTGGHAVAKGGEVLFEGNVNVANLYEVDDKGDVLSIDFWYDSAGPSYEVDRHDFRTVATLYAPPCDPGATDSTREIEISPGDPIGYGAPTGESDSIGRQSTSLYDTYFNVPLQVVDVAGNMTSWEYVVPTGSPTWAIQPSQIHYPNGHTSTFEWTNFGLTGSLNFLGQRTTYTYYTSNDNYGYLQRVEKPDGTATTYEYNVLGQVTRTIHSSGVTVTNTYTESGVPYSALQSSVDNIGNRATYEYDTRGLLTGILQPPLGAAASKRSTLEYDDGGRVVRAINPLGKATTYTYDAHSRLTVFHDKLDQRTTYEYDALHRPIKQTNADATYSTTEYSECHPTQPAEARRRNGDIFSFEYDALGRLTTLDYPSSSRTITFAYTIHATENPYSDLRQVRDTDFATGWDSNYHFEYKYDAYGRLIEERYPDDQKVQLEFDGNEYLDKVKFNTSSFYVDFDYDSLSRLSKATNSLSQWAELGYYTSGVGKGALQQIGYSTGVASTFAYDNLKRLRQSKVDPTSGSDLGRYLVFNADGTIQAVYDDYAPNWASYTGFRWRYFYDNHGRLTQEGKNEYVSNVIVDSPVVQNYYFDNNGNRTDRTGSGAGHEVMDAVPGQAMHNNLNQLKRYQLGSYTDIALTYDDNGQMTRKLDNDGSAAFDWNYTWSPDGRMTRAEDAVGGTDIRYMYDWQGRLVEREDETSSTNGTKRRYYYAGLTPLAERVGTYSGSYSWSDDVYNTLAGILPLFRRTEASGTPVDRVLHYDHVGNVMAESDTSGVVTSTHEYDAFGRPVLSDAGSWWDQNSLHHTGKHYDAATGLFYFNARWYDAQTGRFNSANTPYQPIGEHPYVLCEGNTTSQRDVDGRDVVNNSQYTIWIKHEDFDDFDIKLGPGQTWEGPQDGIFIPLSDTPVFKNGTGLDLAVSDVTLEDGSVEITVEKSLLGSTSAAEAVEGAASGFGKGPFGWMSADWVKQRNHHRPDGTGDWNLPPGYSIE